VHRTAAEIITAGQKLDVLKANEAFLHALLGKSESVLSKLAYSIIRIGADGRRHLADWITSLRLHRTDRPIYPISRRSPGCSALPNSCLSPKRRRPPQRANAGTLFALKFNRNPTRKSGRIWNIWCSPRFLNDLPAAGILLTGLISSAFRGLVECGCQAAQNYRQALKRSTDGRPSAYPDRHVLHAPGGWNSQRCDLSTSFDRLDA